MKRNIIFGVLLLLAICVGSMLMRPVSAQEEVSDEGKTETISRPEAVLLTEDFAYTAGQLTTVSSANWVNFSGTGNFIPVSATGLTYTGYAGSGVGNKIDIISVGTSAEDAYRQFATQATGTTYAAFLVNVPNTTGLLDNASTTGDYFAGFLPSSSTTALSARVSIRLGSAANTFQLGLRATSANAATSFSNTDLAVGTTHLVVISYQLVTGETNDVVNMWINPALGGAQPAATLTQTTGTATDNTDVARFFVRQGTNTTPNASIDGIRVGTAWTDVAVGAGGGGTPTPTPAPKFLFTTRMNGASESTPNNSTGTGYGRVVLNAAETQITASVYWQGLSSNTISGHIHTGAVGVAGPVTFDMTPPTGATSGLVVDKTFAITPAQVATLRAGGMYFNIHSTNFTGGEIRGQLVSNLADPPLDFNGDGKTDFGVVRQTQGGTRLRWFALTNTTPAVERQTDFGIGSDSATPGDFDGDGKDDIAVWRAATDNSYFYILQSSTNTVRYVRFGIPNDDPFQIADFDGDGIDDPAIYRPGASNGAQSQFWWYGSFGVTKNVQVAVNWGVGSDQAAPGDYTGDGKADFCVFRSVSNRLIWFIHPGTGGFDAASTADIQVRFGLPTDAVVPGDYDGDGTTDISVTRAETGNVVWYCIPSSGVELKRRAFWGRSASDFEAQGDYDGDGKTDQAVWRSSTTAQAPATFFVLRSSDGAPQYQEWGFTGDIPAAYDVHNN